MSNGRKFRRQIPPPDHIVQAYAKQACPDCNSDIAIYRRDGHWNGDIRHDDGCPQLAWRERHGSTHAAMIVAEPGRQLDPKLIRDAAQAVASEPGVVEVRIGTSAALSWQEMQAIDDGSAP